MTVAAETDTRLKELKTAWSAAEAKVNAAIGSAPVEDGVIQIDNERRAEARKSLDEMKELKEQINLLEEAKSMAEWGHGQAAGSVSIAAAAQMAQAAAAGASRPQGKSLGEMFTSSEEFKEFKASGGLTMKGEWKAGVADLGAQVKWNTDVEGKNVYSAIPTGAIPGGFKPVVREDIVVPAFRKVRVRDLFPVQPTTAGIIEYFAVTGFVAANAASPVPEWDVANANFALAPHTNLTFEGRQSPTRRIAHWEAAHRSVLDDVPQLQGIIDTHLLYGLRLREDAQLLFGTGNGEDVLGIMNTPNIQTYTRGGVAADTKADDIRRAATKAILAFYEPTGVVMHPADWELVETLKDSTGAYIIAIAVAFGAEQRLWRLPVVDTPAMTQGKALVGSFGLGATLYDRQAGSVRIAEQHSDFFVRDAVAVMAEERVALTVPRPESFVSVTLGS